jgi:hypothetical protein
MTQNPAAPQPEEKPRDALAELDKLVDKLTKQEAELRHAMSGVWNQTIVGA